jgi:hypothetical protein
MAEFRRETGAVAAIAVIAALGLGVIAISVFPNSGGSTTGSTPTTNIGPVPVWYLAHFGPEEISCTIANGSCTFTIVNTTGNASFILQSCALQAAPYNNGTVTTFSYVNGTVGGPATIGVPAHSEAQATCTVSPQQLGPLSAGSDAIGFCRGVSVSEDSTSSGRTGGFSFFGTWA